MPAVIPPDTRAAGQAGHIGDHNNIADMLTQFQTQFGTIPAFTAFGQATLVGGSVTVNNASLTSNSLAIHSRITATGTTGIITVSIVPGVSITFTSSSATETSTIAYVVFN